MSTTRATRRLRPHALRVEAILGGCALREIYEGGNGLVGRSLSSYDASRKLWHQTWVTSRGQLLTLEGRYEEGRMRLEGDTRDAAGRAQRLRGAGDAKAGAVHELEDQRAVAALDTEYQAAVREGHRRRQAVRLPALVQRHLCAHAGRLALCVRPDLAAAASGPVGRASHRGGAAPRNSPATKNENASTLVVFVLLSTMTVTPSSCRRSSTALALRLSAESTCVAIVGGNGRLLSSRLQKLPRSVALGRSHEPLDPIVARVLQ